ncbi:MAG: hypothetical protein Q8920_04205 [Bacillota bacterium]|nr:hypothetical protein [Bacillota bacterium]
MELPDVLGLPVERARYLLKEKGIDIIKLKTTVPPRYRNVEPDESWRVLRVNFIEGRQVELLICKPL